MRREIAILATVGLLLCSGCLGSFWTGGGSTGATTTTGTTTAETTTGTTTAATTTTQGTSDPPDLEAVVSSHNEAIRNGSHWVEGSFVQTFDTEDGTVELRTNLTGTGVIGGNAYTRQNNSRTVDGSTRWRLVESYRSQNGTLYSRKELGSGRVNVSSGPLATPPKLAPIFRADVPTDDLEFEYVGRRTVGGVEGHVFEAVGGDPSSVVPGGINASTFTFIVVVRDGRVRYLRYEVSGTDAKGRKTTIRIQKRWTTFDDAAVPKPDWLDQAG